MKYGLFVFLITGVASMANAAPASDAQVQQFVDERMRPRSEQIRDLYFQIKDDIAAIDDVYEAAASDQRTWSDKRQDVPHQMTANDILAINTFLNDIKTAMENNPQFPIVLKACVKSLK